MRRISELSTKGTGKAKWAALAAALFLASAEALAQEKQCTQVRRVVPTVSASAQPARRIVVSIPDLKLALLEDGRVLKAYRVAVGANVSPSPAGEFKISQRLTDPGYYHPGVVIPPGEDNPLGTRWLGLGVKGYGIHGTNQPGTIGKRASHGCIRMRNRDIEELFELVRAGDPVEFYAGRTEETAQIFGTADTERSTLIAAANVNAAPATAIVAAGEQK